MRCPYCSSPDTKVTDSRDAEDGVRRRRECLACGQRFTTYERVQTTTLMVIKKDGRREEFSRDKLLSGLRKACEKRPLPAGMVESVADDIQATLLAKGVPEVPSQEIGELVMGHLRYLDQIAYIRFASVYREFADIEALKQELESLISSAGEAPGQQTLFSNDELVALGRRLRPVTAERRRGRPRKAPGPARLRRAEEASRRGGKPRLV